MSSHFDAIALAQGIATAAAMVEACLVRDRADLVRAVAFANDASARLLRLRAILSDLDQVPEPTVLAVNPHPFANVETPPRPPVSPSSPSSVSSHLPTFQAFTPTHRFDPAAGRLLALSGAVTA